MAIQGTGPPGICHALQMSASRAFFHRALLLRKMEDHPITHCNTIANGCRLVLWMRWLNVDIKNHSS